MREPRRALLALLVAWLPFSLLAAQEEAPVQIAMPEDLMTFWKVYWDARLRADEGDMDDLVGRNKFEAEDCLNILLDDLSQRDVAGLHHEVRTLAWSLDRVQRTARFITRVRLVLELDQRTRRRRSDALAEQRQGFELEQKALEEGTRPAWEGAAAVYREALEALRAVGDHEYAAACLMNLSEIERRLGRPYEQAQYLSQLVAEAEQLTFHEPLLDEAKAALARLMAQGIDPSRPKPAELGEASAAPVGGGRTLTSWAEGSKAEIFPVRLEIPKKGLPAVSLPTFHPPEQPQLWPMAWVDGQGPSPFDQRSLFFHAGVAWKLVRPGITKFGFDVDGDGSAEVEFSATTTPSLVEVPVPGERDPVALMVAAASDREKMFGVDTNYSPKVDGSYLRFSSGGYLEGKVRGETWQIFDANVDGNFGLAAVNVDDLVTWYDEEDHVDLWAPDAVLIGKARKALPLSTVMHLADGFYNAKVDAAAGTVTLRKLDLQTGFLQIEGAWGVPPTHLVLREVGGKLDGAAFDVLPDKRGGAVELPVGEYEIAMGRIQKGEKSTLDQVRIYRGRSQKVKIDPGNTTKLALGAPYQLVFQNRSDGDEIVLDTQHLRCFGRGGEEYAMFFDDPLQPDVSVRVGKKVEKPEKLRRAGIEEWRDKNNPRDTILWFPVEFRVERPREGIVEFQLTQKSHSLLGGPLTSEWIGQG